MPSELYKNFASNQPQMNMNQMFEQFKQNPLKYLGGMNIPQNVSNPADIVRHLANSGQIPPQLQGRVNAMLGRR